MKHIIEKHVTSYQIMYAGILCNQESIPCNNFPALISDLEAEMERFIYWLSDNGYEYIGITWHKHGRVTNYTFGELLKIYKEQCNLEGKLL